ncbi:peroxidase-like [Thrips palmi]|uniref:Peroxidase-like n=1 Tax=Thrips palmi TaxID=161013 RepID=A0A6P8Y459_THRPL|nr:peroxidase-like [Thrips palmi]
MSATPPRHGSPRWFVQAAVLAVVLAAVGKASARCPNTPAVSCPRTPWRSFDGSCNNPQDSTRGMANTPLIRILPATYADGRHQPRRGFGNATLPSARLLVTTFLPDRNAPSRSSNIMFMTWAQLVSHDAARLQAPFPRANSACCDAEEPTDQCSRIPVPDDDPFFPRFGVKCFGVGRAAAAPCSGTAFEQNSLVSHYLDASFVYGSNAATANRLREGRGGRLRTQVIMGQEFLPRSAGGGLDAGDGRVTITPMLALLQTLWLLEHNRVARRLSDMNVLWDDERLFQETRRIVIAQWQLITYRDFLPKLIGAAAVDKNGLRPSVTSFSQDYDPSVDASTANDFTTGAFRSFHSMVANDVRFGGGGGEMPGRPMLLSGVPAEAILSPTNFRRAALGTLFQPRQGQDRFIAAEITTKMFAGNSPFGGDLLATDIQRARDNGLGSYNDYREQCNLPRAKEWTDFTDTIPSQHIEALSEHYEKPDDVDVMVGGLLEQWTDSSSEPSFTSPVFRCLVVDQFKRWKTGDSFFFDRLGQFALAQLRTLNDTSLARILCDNVPGIVSVPRDAFSRPGAGGTQEVRCSTIRGINLNAWREARRG